jgi:AraC-like DNA-binding protein
MIRTILLLTPVYVTLFWSILLNFFPGRKHAANRFLGKFMIACFVVFMVHFLYFSHYISIERWFDAIYQYASLIVYPLFYVYFRLLFKERKFSLRIHGKFLLIPTLLFLLYLGGSLAVPGYVFEDWLYNKGQHSEFKALNFLNILNVLIRLVFVVQVFLIVSANVTLINGFRKNANQYYSDIFVIRSTGIVRMNVLIVVCGFSSIILSLLGRRFFISELTGITLASIIFSTSLFIIGWFGVHQKAFYPTIDETLVESDPVTEDALSGNRHQLMEKITSLFRDNKIHLNSKLTIQEVAQSVGTNRTYVSSIINQHYGTNFCSFVNNFRIDELEQILKKNPTLTNQALAESGGFGSVDSLKRAVSTKTGLSITSWKTSINKT